MKKLLLLALILFGNSLYANPSSLSLLQMDTDPQQEALLQQYKTRRQMLNWHSYTAWASVGLMAATLASAPEGKISNAHKWLGISAGILYLSSAALAYWAPRPDETKQSQNIMIHKKLAFVHFPAMLLTVIAGLQAHKQYEDGEELSGLAKAHKAFAAITTASFATATVLSMDWTLNLLPTSSKEVACVFTRRF